MFRRAPFLVAAASLLVFGAGAVAVRLPADIRYERGGDSPGPVVFSHATHVELADNKCTGCHPEPFKMLKPERRVTHDQMKAGKACGLCHDGKTASGLDDACDHCHRAAGSAP